MKPLGSGHHSGGNKLYNPSGNTANTDSELYVGKATALHARQGLHSGIGSGSKNVSASLAQR
jgi:hypothetical protein